MKMTILAIMGVAALSVLSSCDKGLLTYRSGDIRMTIEAGGEWLHDFPLFLGIRQKNPPQIAVWIEDEAGNYLSTIFVTGRSATQSWRGGAKSRPEALPVWSFAHAGGSVDGLSGATPKSGFDVKLRPVGDIQKFVVKVEVNHSTDWNAAWPEGATTGSSGYSGDSGQPAIVYAANIDLASGKRSYVATLEGHGSPDGSNGGITADTSALTSALNIVKQITIEIE